MAIPSAVKKQAEAAEAKFKAQQDSDIPEQAEETAAEEPQAPEVQDPPKASDDDWKNKYQVLQGKYNAEVPRLQDQIRVLNQQFQDLKAQAETKPAPQADTEMFDQLRADYGDELVKPLEHLTAQNASLVNEIQNLKAQLTGVQGSQEQNAQEIFLERLTTEIPTWQEINTNQAFHSWLAEPDGLSGKTRQNALDEAGKAMNASRVVAIFKAFINASTSNQGQRKKQIEQQTAPSSSPAEPQKSAGPKIYAASEIRQFNEEAAKKKLFLTNPKLYQQKSHEYTMAQTEGRVDPNR